VTICANTYGQTRWDTVGVPYDPNRLFLHDRIRFGFLHLMDKNDCDEESELDSI
jgi:hypothetical protein